MLSENIRTLRKAKGFSQEELAIRLNVVRQTVSKWEKGLSVPDAELLIRLAEVLETDVPELLGTPREQRDDRDLVEQLSRINEQLAVRNRRSRRVWRTIAIVLASLAGLILLVTVLGVTLFGARRDQGQVQMTEYVVESGTEE